MPTRCDSQIDLGNLRVQVSAIGQTSLRVLTTQFGDGYRERRPDGINTEVRRWTLSTPPMAIADVLEFEDELRALGAGAFEWVPPGEDTNRLWELDPVEWSRVYQADHLASVSFNIRSHRVAPDAPPEPPPPPPPPPYPYISYSRSSDFSINAPPTNEGMANGIFAEVAETGVAVYDEFGPELPWVQMDLGSVRSVSAVVIGADFDNTLTAGEGAWTKAGTENRDVEYSLDGLDWTLAFNTGTFTEGIQTYPVDFDARFIRILGLLDTPTNASVAVTEFYAISEPGPPPPLIIDVGAITYSQSSVYVSNTAADNAGMTNDVFLETSQTATEGSGFEHVTMDLGGVFPVGAVYVGSATTSLAGGWDKSFTEDLLLQHSIDGEDWTTFANTGTFDVEGIKAFAAGFDARYIKLRPFADSGAFVAVTEFYATTEPPPDPPPPPPPPEEDLLWANVVFLASFEGDEGSTTFTDLSLQELGIEAFGAAAITTADPDFPLGALNLNGASSYAQTVAAAILVLGDEDYCIDFYAKARVVTGNDGVFTTGGESSGVSLSVSGSSWAWSQIGAGDGVGAPATADVRQHMALTREGGFVRLFIEGALAAGPTNAPVTIVGDRLKIGYYFLPMFGFDGLVSWFRVTKGNARWVEDFTPPPAPFPTTGPLPPPPPPPGEIDVDAIVYTQHSVYSTNTAANNAGMTNGVTAETSQTATNGDSSAYLRMDFGSVCAVRTIYVGCDFDSTLAGGWGRFYSENLPMEYSEDGTTWHSAGTTGVFTTALKAYSVEFDARYVQIRSTLTQGYVVATEFYATSEALPPPPPPPPEDPATMKLALLFEGANDSTDFIDSGANGATVTPSGGAKITTATAGQGASSGDFDRAAGSTLTLSSVPDLNFATGDFRIRFRARMSVLPEVSETFTVIRATAAFDNTAPAVSLGGGPRLRFSLPWLGYAAETPLLAVSAGEWHSYEVARVGSSLTLSLDEEVVFAGTLTSNVNLNSGPTTIGSNAGSNGFDGQLDTLFID